MIDFNFIIYLQIAFKMDIYTKKRVNKVNNLKNREV